jgi:putative PEP-CTERM system TPR-repeat lipoprotein
MPRRPSPLKILAGNAKRRLTRDRRNSIVQGETLLAAVDPRPAETVMRRTPVVRFAALGLAALVVAGCDTFVSADKHLERAQAHIERNEHRPAMAQLKTALQKEPEHAGARLALADLSLWLADLESAQKELDRAIKSGAPVEQTRPLQYELLLAQRRYGQAAELLHSDESTPLVKRLVLEARIAAGRGDAQQAAETIQRALEESPEDPEALVEAARIAAAQGDLRPSLELPERITQSGPMRARALHLYGVALLGQGEHARARDAFVEAQQDGRRLPAVEQMALAAARTEANLALEDAAGAEQSLSSIGPWGRGSLIEHYLRARVAMLKEDYINVVAECQRALRINPEHVQSQLLMSAAQLAQGSLEQAQDTLSRLLANHPGNGAARKLLAQVHLARNQPAEAQRVLSASTQTGEPDGDADWLIGAAMLRSGSIDDALRHLERSVAADPDNLARRVDLAGAYISSGDPQKAVELLESIPQDAPVAARAKTLLVLAAATGKPRAQARREIENLAARHSDDAALVAVAGAYLGAVGDPAGGRKLLERAVQLDAQAVRPRLSLAQLDAATGRREQAQQRLREVIELDPKSQAARLGLAELAWSAGDRDASRKWLEEAVSVDPAAVDARLRLAQIAFLDGQGSKARSLLDQALSVTSDRKTTLTGAGRVLARAGLADEALARFREAAAAGDPEATLAAARLHLELEQSDQARALIQSALATRPNWREAQRMLVMIDAREGNVASALQRARKLVGDASPAALHATEGDLYMAAGQAKEAAAAYDAAHRLQPTARLAVKLYHARRSAGEAGAERVLTQWLEREPGAFDVRRILAAHYESRGDADRAVAEYERLLAAGRVDPPMLNNLAWLLHERGDPRALELAQRAYESAPQVAEIADTYGWILVRMDKIADGLDVLERALAQAPANPDIQYHAAYAYSRAGKAARAAELARQALQSTQAFASRDQASQLLESMAASAGN